MEHIFSSIRMIARKFILLSAFVIIAGCSNGNNQVQEHPASLQTMNEFGIISFNLPQSFNQRIERPDGSLAFINFNNNTVHREPGDQLLEAYKPSESCSYIGGKYIVDKHEPDGSFISWGKVTDEWDNGSPAVNCLLVNGYDKTPLPGKEYYSSAYALCAHKDTKNVFICISQVKDNPDIAKQIFDSFAWTK